MEIYGLLQLIGYIYLLVRTNEAAAVASISYDRGTYKVGHSTTNTKQVSVVFATCFKAVPNRITATTAGATQWKDKFSTDVSFIYLWGFTANVKRTDIGVGWGQQTVIMTWRAFFGTTEYIGSTCSNSEANCTNIVGSVNCSCPAGFAEPNCTNINGCAGDPCSNGSNCTDLIDAFSCTCAPGYTGKTCATDINDCLLAPCQNGATCIDLVAGYNCTCLAGTTGTNCSINMNDCLPDPCQNGANCTDLLNNHSCSCLPGFTGNNCEIDINDCAATPCLNNATCVDLVNNFRCECSVGFTGTTCRTNIDDCAVSPCENGASCVDKVNDYTCLCPSGFTGKNCTTNIDDCVSNPCQNGGTCSDEVNGYVCKCADGFSDTNCTTDINDCAPQPCLNNGTCSDLVSNFRCDCVSGFTGKACGIDINDCAPLPCKNGGSCVDKFNDYECNCMAGYSGKNCSTDINDCLPTPCKNGATCTDQVNGFSCACANGFTGSNCTININDCAPQPCLNNGTCSDLVSNFRCDCVSGFTGKACGIDINDCLPTPCKNGATCTDQVNGFSCACANGFTGSNCTINIDDCVSLPCLNNGTCTDLVNAYKCLCAIGFSGRTCDVNIDDCQPSPCVNGASCTDKVNDYECSCAPGYSGKNCQTDNDDCRLKPCLNGATCSDQVNAYACFCVSGFTGQNCSINIDDCLPQSCFNGGTCIDGINSFRCQCTSGFIGTTCLFDTDDCATKPCINGGSCIDGINSFQCICPTGYEGGICERNIDDCSPNKCTNNGTCYDLIATYHCDCIVGYSGFNCEILPYECRIRPCSPYSSCVLLNNGSYGCQCNQDFDGDGYECKPTCARRKIWVQSLNQALTFPRTGVGLTTISDETCANGNGRPLASIDCVFVNGSISKAKFSSLYSPNCDKTVTTVVNQIKANMTTDKVASSVAFLKLVTHNVEHIDIDIIEQVTWGLEEIHKVVTQHKTQITSNVMFDTIQVTDSISGGLMSYNVTNSTSPLNHAKLKQRTLHVLEQASFLVGLVGGQQSVTLTTPNTTVQIVQPRPASGGRSRRSSAYDDLTFTPFKASSNSTPPKVGLTIPGDVLDQAAASQSDPVHVSFFSFNNDVLFPSKDHPKEIVSAKIKGFKPETTKSNLKLVYRNESARQGAVRDPNNTLKESVTRTQCSVWDPKEGQWVPDGCSLVLGSEPPRCHCVKLANFAMLVSTKVLPSAFAMGIVSYIGLILSAICLIATIAIYLYIPELRSRQPTTFLINICVCLLAVNMIFLTGSSQVTNLVPCYLVTVILHFFLLATWFWMAANAYNMYHALVKVMITSTSIPLRAKIICYLVPFIITLLTSGIAIFDTDRDNYRADNIFFESAYKSRHVCWLRFLSLRFGFLLPVGILAIFNISLFVIVFSKITCRRTKIQSTAKSRRSSEDFAMAVALIVVMGLTWLFGFLMLVAEDVIYQTIMAWLFTIFNSTQGISIFLLNCVRQRKVRAMWCKIGQKGKKNRSTSGQSTASYTVNTRT